MMTQKSEVISLAPGSADLERQVAEATSQHEGRVFVLDCSGESPPDAWKTWVADATTELMLRTGVDVRAGWRGTIVTVVKISSDAHEPVGWRHALELAALEAIRGVMGSIALERAGEGVVANLVVINEKTTDHDVNHAVSYLLDKRCNGFTTGATLRLTCNGYQNEGVVNQGRLPGRVLITGAAGMIGFATVQAFTRAGYQPILSDVNEARLKERAAELGGAEILPLDVTDRQSLRTKVRNGLLGEKLAAVVLVHGFQGSYALADLDASTIESSIAVNGTSAVGIIEEVMPLLDAGSAFSIVSSQCGIRAEAMTAAYCAPKFALIGLMQGLAPYLAQKGISINELCPGPVDTPFLRTYFERFALTGGKVDLDAVVAERAAAMPVGRFARPEEMGEALRFLAQLDATGVILAPTGGETLT